MAKLNLNPLSDSVGAEILDFDITNFDAVKFQDIRIALDTYGGLLFFRNQELSWKVL